MFLYTNLKKLSLSSIKIHAERCIPTKKKIRKRMLITFLYIKLKKNPPPQLPPGSCQKVHSYKTKNKKKEC
jgi:hypothetical protein